MAPPHGWYSCTRWLCDARPWRPNPGATVAPSGGFLDDVTAVDGSPATAVVVVHGICSKNPMALRCDKSCWHTINLYKVLEGKKQVTNKVAKNQRQLNTWKRTNRNDADILV